MKYRIGFGSLGLVHLALVPALLTLQCGEEDDADFVATSPGSGGESASGGSGPAGETAGPVLICGNEAIISQCDPLSSAPCAEGETCDHFAAFGGFKCFDNPEPAGAGEFCDNETVVCGPGLYCETFELMVCQHYCCDDSDCETGSCYGADEFFLDGQATVGACYDEFGGDCAFLEDEDEVPEHCLNAGGAAGSAP